MTQVQIEVSQVGIERILGKIRQVRRILANPGGARHSSVEVVGRHFLRHAMLITHRWSGGLASGHRLSVEKPSSIILHTVGSNPWTGEPIENYAGIEEARGGSHAFYRRTIAEVGDVAAREGIQVVFRSLPS